MQNNIFKVDKDFFLEILDNKVDLNDFLTCSMVLDSINFLSAWNCFILLPVECKLENISIACSVVNLSMFFSERWFAKTVFEVSAILAV